MRRFITASSVLLCTQLALACGGDDAPPAAPDGAPPAPLADAGVDATLPSPDAEVPDGRVHVQVFAELWAAVEPDALTFFSGPDGALVFAGRTDAEGRIAAFLPEGGSVTVLLHDALDHGHLYTHTGVLPGEDIHFGGDHELPSWIEAGALHVAFTAPPGDVNYTVHTPCRLFSPSSEESRSPLEVPLLDPCAFDGKTSVALVASARSTGQLLGVAYAGDIPAVPGSTVTLPHLVAPVRVQRKVTNLPAGLVGAHLSEYGHNGHGATWSTGANSTSWVNVATFEPMFPAGFSAPFDEQEIELDRSRNSTGSVDRYSSVDRLRAWPTPAQETFDAADFLPPAGIPAFDGERVSWTLGAGGDTADYETVAVFLPNSDDPTVITQWTTFVPGGTTELVLPQLPAEIAPGWQPAPGAARLTVESVDVDLWDGFHEARARGQFPWPAEAIVRGQPHVLRFSSAQL